MLPAKPCQVGKDLGAARWQPSVTNLSWEECSMNVRPLADRILVRRIEEKETVKGGIIIPDTAKEKPQEGEVVAVGPGRLTEEGKRIAIEVKKGDRVL